MKISLNWVKEYSDIKLPVDKLVEKIGAQLGAVEETIELGKKYEGITVAKVVTCENHPNADKLKVCMVDDGRTAKKVKRDDKGLVQVVCGAPNVEAGQLVVWLPPGVTVPSTYEKEPLVLEARDLRGVVSNGMLASASELDLSEDHGGILVLDFHDAKPGDDFAETFKINDTIIDIENKMFTHRPDCFGILGVAREIAGITHVSFQSPEWYLKDPRFSSSSKLPLEIRVEDSKLTPRFMAVAMTVDNEGKSIVWTQSYLSRVGIRPINKVVDITNYMMHLTAQPLHAYDYDKVKELSGSKPTLMARMSKKGETIKLLGGKVVTFDEPALVIATDKQVVGIAGVMGGADTEVDDNTKNIIIECANFDMYSIRRTAMHYGIFTDAVTRFNKGQSPLQTDRVLAQTVDIVIKLAQGEVASKTYDAKRRLTQPGRVIVDADFVNQRLGTKLSLKQMANLLENVEFKLFKPPAGKNQLYIEPPFWRTDIEIPEDIVEEIGRLYGYDHLPLVLPEHSIKPTGIDPMLAHKSALREILSEAGANEILTYSFVHENLLKKAEQDPEHCYQLSNALSPDLQYYRPSLVPSLLDKVHPNIKAGFSEFALFEINQTHSKDLVDEDKLPIEEYRLGLVFAADEKTVKAKYDGAPYFQAKRYAEEILEKLGIKDAVYEPTEDYEPKMAVGRQAIAPFEKSRSVLIKNKEGQLIGELGEFKPSVRKAFKLPAFIAGMELDVAQLLKLSGQNNYVPLPRYPKVEQDISLKVPKATSYQELAELLNASIEENKPQNSRATLTPIDIYQPEHTKNRHITFRLEIASYEKTMVTEEVNELLNKAAEAASHKFGAERL